MTGRIFTPPPSGGTNTWLTPLPIVMSLGDFDLDPCGFPGHQTAKKLVCLPEDGLEADWSGRVWLNPPYGNEAKIWMQRLADHGNGIALIFARTDTQWFFDHVWDRADAVLFLRGRISFISSDLDTPRNNGGAASVLVAYGTDNAKALKDSGLAGQFLLIPKPEPISPLSHK